MTRTFETVDGEIIVLPDISNLRVYQGDTEGMDDDVVIEISSC